MKEFSDKIERFLPQYLSQSSKKLLLDELKQFPTDGTKDTIYTTALKDAPYLLQGDGISKVLYMNFPDTQVLESNVILFSNTCDMSLNNERKNPCRIMYAPLLNYDKYEAMIKKHYSQEAAEGHLKDLRSQHVTQALYLPKGGGLDYNAIVFFDRAISIPMNEESVNLFCKNRLFTLSDYGLYLFLLKLSIHFTRIQEKIDRTAGVDMGALNDRPQNSTCLPLSSSKAN